MCFIFEFAKFYNNVRAKPPVKTNVLTSNNHSERGDFFYTQPARLRLGDNTVFQGVVPKNQTAICCGEVVFNTGMTGYVESLTDPSYAGQILMFTYPMIGNYGVGNNYHESGEIQVRGVIVSELAKNWSHSSSTISLFNWLRSAQIPILMGVDTRALTKYLRAKGTMLGCFGPAKKSLVMRTFETTPYCVKQPTSHNPQHTKTVVLVDCGVKNNILQSLLQLPIHVRQVPHDYDYSHEQFDGVLLSNGPGDPEVYKATIRITKKVLRSKKPIFGICLGSQVMALAAGGQTYKLQFGHRGHNQPCVQMGSNRCYITSQNHGYAIREDSLSKNWRVLFRNLNDGSVEGIEHASLPFFSVQFHPEACPGPTDTAWLFERFYQNL